MSTEFTLGQLITLVDASSMVAPVGALARVVHIDGEWIDVEWEFDRNQSNGGYKAARFKVALLKSQYGL